MSGFVLKVATCQFAVSSSIKRNSRTICEFLRKAKKSKADIVHFSECALSGYVGTDFASFNGYDWGLLKEETETIMALAAKLGLWVVLGSTHRLTEPNKPHNSLYLINPRGKIVDRYDKRFCTNGDLRRLTPGNRFVYFTINGVKCSLLICFDLRFTEIYRELYKQKVNCIFQSFYNARQKGPSVHTHIMRQTMQCRAATNYFWVSMANSSGYYSPYPSCFIQPDGKIVHQLKPNRAGVMVNTVELKKKFYDPMADFRDMAIKGKLGNGPKTIADPRSRHTKRL
ncbi:MAG TPA: carbon-nitrogen hydrolase family protein [Sedimentisphaerales bacterium]|nr:carbon-nitrogen hydrolase family protein [Sedimentisphaerales bacterium]